MVQRRRPFDNPTLVGRDREVGQLRASLNAMLAGRGGLVLVSGEAGIGKTTLVRRLIEEAREHGAIILTGSCFDLTTTPPYGPWSDLFGSYSPVDDLPQAVPAVLQAGDDAHAITSQVALFEQVREFFASVVCERPLVLALEDLHWSDPASLDLLRFLARRLTGLPLIIVATYRNDELTRRHPLFQLIPSLVREAEALRLDLHRLDEDDVWALVTSMYNLPESDASRLVAYLVQHAEGNPLYTGELLRTLEGERLLSPLDDGWRLGHLGRVRVPPLVQQVIERRLSHLDEQARELLEIAAVIGQEIPFELWVMIADTEEEHLLGAVRQATEAHLLEETQDGAGLRFAHALMREALYNSVSPPQRRVHHRQVGDVLSRLSGADPDTVAYHFQQADDPRAVEWLIRAGLRAERRYALIMAAGQYETVQALLKGDESRAQARGWLLLRCGWLLRWSHTGQEFAYVREARQVAVAVRDPVLAAYSLFLFGWLRSQENDSRLGGMTEMESGVTAIDALSPADRARTDSPLAILAPGAFSTDTARLNANEIPMPGQVPGTNHFRQRLVLALAERGHFAEAIAMGEQHIAQVTEATTDEALMQATCFNTYIGLGQACTALGRPNDARHWLRLAGSAVAAFGEHAVVSYVLLLEMYLLITYDTEQVTKRRELARQARQAARYSLEAHATEQTSTAGYHIPVALLDGRWAEARAVLPASSHWNWARWLLGKLAYGQGRFDEAWAQVYGALEQGPKTEPGMRDFFYAIDLVRLAVTLALDAGDRSEARQWLEMHDHWIEWSGTVVGRAEGHLLWSRYYKLTGDLDRARQHATQAHEHASNPRQPLALIATDRALGELALQAERFAEAAERLRRSLALAQTCAVPFEQALSLLALAELSATTGQVAEARGLLQEVATICQPLQAKPTLERASRLEQMLGQAPATGHPTGLSARELEVLQLAAEGLTNAEIGEELFISPRTVAHHLTAVYNKLGVNSRAAAVARLANHRPT